MMSFTNTVKILILAFLVQSNASANPLSPLFAALPDTVDAPLDNPATPQKIELGKKLFFDPRISKSGNISCNSCHNVMGSGTDNLAHSFGVGAKLGGRSAPTVWNAALLSVQFWDGRAATLEDQAKGPMLNPVEMAMPNHEAVVKRLSMIPGYQKEFKTVFGEKNALTIDNVAKAIAAYERTLLTPNSPFDRYQKGEKKALPAAAIRGLNLVQKVGCTSCHNGPNFAGPKLPVGTGFYQKFPLYPGSSYEAKYNLGEDLGRFEATHKEEDKHFWRVPTWRNIATTAPYFHNGSVKSLDEAVRVMAKMQLNLELKEPEVQDVVAFLESLTGVQKIQTLPQLPPSLLTNGLED